MTTNAWCRLIGVQPPRLESLDQQRRGDLEGSATAVELLGLLRGPKLRKPSIAPSALSMQTRDAMVVTQHAFLSDTCYENAGAMLFGLAPAPGHL